MRELHLFENWVGGSEKERVLLRSCDSTSATLRFAVAGEEPVYIISLVMYNAGYGREVYVEQQADSIPLDRHLRRQRRRCLVFLARKYSFFVVVAIDGNSYCICILQAGVNAELGPLDSSCHSACLVGESKQAIGNLELQHS